VILLFRKQHETGDEEHRMMTKGNDQKKGTYHHFFLTLTMHLPSDIKRSSSGLCNRQLALGLRLEVPCDVWELGMSLHFSSGKRPVCIP
jgi:hypothetical protein